MHRLILLTNLVLVGSALAGCANSEPLKDQSESNENQIAGILGQVNEERPTMATYRTIMQNLNSYYNSQGASYAKDIVLSPEQTSFLDALLSNVGRLDRATRSENVKNKSFNTLSDAVHLDGALMFRDAAAALLQDLGDVPPRSDEKASQQYQMDLAQHFFNWTMRQVALAPRMANVEPWPAHEVLRRGSGDAEERMRVFLSLLQQTDLDGCAILIKKQFKEENVTATRMVPVLAGVLLGKSIYLFDPRQGKPVPSADGKGVATLAQVRQQVDLLKAVMDQESPSAAQINDAEVVLLVNLPSLSPRMKVLEKEFDLLNNRVKLTDDPLGRIQRFKEAGVTAKAWTSEERPGYPALIINRYTEASRGDPRVEVIVPRQKLIPEWGFEAEKKLGIAGTTQSLFSEFDRRFLSLRLEPGGGRDLLVRGRAPQAIAKISKLENDLDRALDVFRQHVEGVEDFRTKFLPTIYKLQDDLKALQQQLAKETANTPETQELQNQYLQKIKTYDQLWKEQGRRNMVSNLGSSWAMPELREHITYFMALAKMEMAIRAEMRFKRNPKAPWPDQLPLPAQQFASAAEWFRRYEALVLPMNSAVWLDAVKLRLKECEQKEAELGGVVRN